MLRFMRAAAATILAKILLLVLVSSFLVWGIADFIRETPDSVLANVGDQKLTVAEYQFTLSNDLQRINASLGQNITLQQANAFGLPARILSRILAEKTLDTDVKRFNIAISERETVTSILQDKQFATEDGQFNRAFYNQTLRNLGLSEAKFVEQRNSQLRRQIFADAYLAGLAPPKILQSILASGVYEERAITTLTLPLSKIAMPAKPPLTTLKDYYNSTKERWSAPEYRSVLMLIYTPKPLQIDDKTLQTEFEATKSNYFQPERRRIYQLTFSDEKTAKNFTDNLKTKTFEQLAEAKGDDADVYDLGTVTQQDLTDEPVRIASFSAKKGEVKLVPNGRFGATIVKVIDIIPEKTPNFAEIKPQIINALSKSQNEKLLSEIEKKVEDALSNGNSFQDIARDLDVTFTEIDSVSRSGINAKGQSVPEFVGKDELLKATFEAAEGFEITPIKFSDGAIVWVNVAKVTPAALIPFENVETQVYQNWAAQEQFNLMQDKAKQLANEANDGIGLKLIAERENLKIGEISYFSRATAPKNLTSLAIREIYSTAPNKYGTFFEDETQSMIVFKVADARIPARAKDGLPQEELTKITQGYQDDLFGIYVLARQNALKMSINDSQLKSILGTPTLEGIN